jgi:hypothetical protein
MQRGQARSGSNGPSARRQPGERGLYRTPKGITPSGAGLNPGSVLDALPLPSLWARVQVQKGGG